MAQRTLQKEKKKRKKIVEYQDVQHKIVSPAH